MTKKIKFGLWYSFRNPKRWETNLNELYSQHLQQIAWAETIGYQKVWLTEHHFCEDAHAPSILPICAAVAAKTQKIRIATGVLLLPLHNAVRVAEDTATIDILSNGRFELGVGVGYRPAEFHGLGVDSSDRGSLSDEGLEIIEQLLEGKSLSYAGKHYRFSDLSISPLPVQKPKPPIWVGGFVPAAARRAARFGTGYVGFGDMKQLLDCYMEERSKLGYTDQPDIAGGHFWLITTKNPKKTFDDVAPHVLYQMHMYNKWLGEAGQDLFPNFKSAQELEEQGILLCVTPEEACEIIGNYAEAHSITDYYTWTIPPGYPTEKMNEYLGLFASDVIPYFS